MNKYIGVTHAFVCDYKNIILTCKYFMSNCLATFVCIYAIICYQNIIINNDFIVVSFSDYEGASEVWQLVPSDMFSLITIPFQGKTVKVGVSNDHVM